MEHRIEMRDGDTLIVHFKEHPSLSYPADYFSMLERALHRLLYDIHQDQNYGQEAQQMNPSLGVLK